MAENDQSNRDEISEKLKERILDLDAAHDISHDNRLNKIANEYIDALEDTTRFTDSKIDVIASEVLEDFERREAAKLKHQQNRREFRQKIKIMVLSAIIIGGLSYIAFQYYPLRQAITKQPDINHPDPSLESSLMNGQLQNGRALLDQVLEQLTPAKRQIVDFYMIQNALPGHNDIDSENLLPAQSSALISDLTLSDQGRLNVLLSEQFGDNKKLIVEPETTNNGAHISWRCETNVAPIDTTIAAPMPCTYRPNLSL